MKKWSTVLCVVTAFVFSGMSLFFNAPLQAAGLEWSGNINALIGGEDRKDTGSSSDIVLDEVVLALDAEISENVTATAIVKYEEEELFLDEGYLTLNNVGALPLSVTTGKWVLPFGVFESHLISDPLTQDAYEINSAGVSLTYAPEEVPGLDLSLAVYSNEGSLFTEGEDDLGNFLLNVSFAQEELYSVSLYYDSEQGVEDRNDSAGVSLGGSYENLTLDAEYIMALQRDEDGPEESAYSVSAAYQVLPALEVAARYEGYDDDDGDDNTKFDPDEGLAGLESRISVGANYELYENTTLSAEYRISELENDDQSSLKEWALQVSVEF